MNEPYAHFHKALFCRITSPRSVTLRPMNMRRIKAEQRPFDCLLRGPVDRPVEHQDRPPGDEPLHSSEVPLSGPTDVGSRRTAGNLQLLFP